MPAVPGVLIYKEFFRLIRVTLAKNILKNHSHKNKRAGIAGLMHRRPLLGRERWGEAAPVEVTHQAQHARKLVVGRRAAAFAGDFQPEFYPVG